MPFNPELDEILKKWTCDETGLMVSINQYGDGEPKLQIGPRLFKKKDGTESQRKSGRLTIEDVMWLYDIIDEIKDELSHLAGPQA
jgi:hypothetical protein